MCAKSQNAAGKPRAGRGGLIVLVRSETENFAMKAQGRAGPVMLRDANFLFGRAKDGDRVGLRQAALKYVEIPTDKLNDQLLGFMDKVGAMVGSLPENLGKFTLQEIELSLEITAKGEIGFLGTGGGLEGTGGIKMTLRRKEPQPAPGPTP
jgi:hypothetical protein